MRYPKTQWNNGKRHHRWEGGRFRTKEGYIVVLTGITSLGHSRYTKEHRLLMEKKLGRKLHSWEIVHHKNGIRDDNRIENLEIVLRSTHFRNVHCPKCGYEFKIK